MTAGARGVTQSRSYLAGAVAVASPPQRGGRGGGSHDDTTS
jgi:hypothetical protein